MYQEEIYEDQEPLISKQLLPPALDILPRELLYPDPCSLLPLLTLTEFYGIIPQYQPLNQYLQFQKKSFLQTQWIGKAFKNIVYQRFTDVSYKKIHNLQSNWNLLIFDTNKLNQDQIRKKQNQKLQQFYQPKENDQTLVFQSRFQSGNLSMASKVSDSQYNLLLQNDINTSGYTQWFFFRVKNTIKNKRIKFNILNLYKHNSLYKSGMKITIYSREEARKKNISWYRGGQQIQYFQNGYSKSSGSHKKYHSLSWIHQFKHNDDEVFFAYNYPFGYTDLMNFLQKIELQYGHKKYLKRVLICKTLANNRVQLLTITDKATQNLLNKMTIVLTARVHPGQTVSSYVIKGIIQFLLSQKQTAIQLRKHFVFKIFPMLNPDGIIHGNYRSSIAGCDLNRKWNNPSKSLHGQIYYTKKYILSLVQTDNVVFFCDFHGHSRKKNVFFYGCHDQNQTYGARQFPFIMSKLSSNFSFQNSSFTIQPQKQGTSRAIMWKQLKIQNVFTLQSSFCGPSQQNIHFSAQHYEKIGIKFCQGLAIYFHPQMRDRLLSAAVKQTMLFLDIHQESYQQQTRNKYLTQFYQDEQRLSAGANLQNSQGSEYQSQKQNIITEQVFRKYFQYQNKSMSLSPMKQKIMEIKKNNDSQARNLSFKNQKREEKKFVIKQRRKETSKNLGKDLDKEKKVFINLQPKVITPVIDIQPFVKRSVKSRSLGRSQFINSRVVVKRHKQNNKITSSPIISQKQIVNMEQSKRSNFLQSRAQKQRNSLDVRNIILQKRQLNKQFFKSNLGKFSTNMFSVINKNTKGNSFINVLKQLKRKN